MKFDKLIELRGLINNIVDNYIFDDDEYKIFNMVLGSQITAVNKISKMTSERLIVLFGKCEPPKE